MDKISIIKYYIDKYKPEVKSDINERNREEKRVRAAVNKIMDKNSIYKDLPFELLSVEERCKLINHLLEKADREIIANMSKEDVNRNYYGFVLPDEQSDFIYKNIFEDMMEYKPCIDFNTEKYFNREIIRNKELNKTETVIKDLLEVNEKIIRALKEEQGMFFMNGIEYMNFSYIKKYIDYLTDGILQLINYRILVNSGVEEKKRILKCLVETIEELETKIDKQIENHKIIQNNLTAEEVTRIFFLYRVDGSYYREYIGITKILKKEIEKNRDCLFNILEDKYKVEKILLSNEEIASKRVEEMVTEGLKVNDYKTKLNETRELIDLFNRYGGRQCYPNCLQDIKVYFREIFMSKQTYRGRQALRIARGYLKESKEQGIQDFENKAHYLFLREKISRGYFRETGNLASYMLKLEVQEKLYETILKTYLFYDYDTTIEFIYELNRNILKRMYELLA